MGRSPKTLGHPCPRHRGRGGSEGRDCLSGLNSIHQPWHARATRSRASISSNRRSIVRQVCPQHTEQITCMQARQKPPGSHWVAESEAATGNTLLQCPHVRVVISCTPRGPVIHAVPAFLCRRRVIAHSTCWIVLWQSAVPPLTTTNSSPMPFAAVAGQTRPSSGGTTHRKVACWLMLNPSRIAPAV